MKLYSENKEYKLYEGSMLDMLEFIDEESVDSIITDPPYELNFMNKGWDNSGIAFQKETWEKCFKVLKSGGYLLAFGGSRTYHRIACAIEDAGFEIRDTIMWLYGSGFPKSLNVGLAIDKKLGCSDRGHRIAVANRNHPDGTLEPNGENLPKYEARTEEGKEWDGYGTALKPAYEPIIVARKPIETTIAENVMKYGVGGLNIDECRVGETGGVKKVNIEHNSGSKNCGFGCNGELEELKKGRFPANVILTYDETDFDEVCGGFPNTKSGSKIITNKDVNRKGLTKENPVFNTTNCGFKTNIKNDSISNYGDSGSASRYFYCAKASKKDRDEGLDVFEEIDGGSYQFRQDGSLDGKIPVRKNIHPTVKPIELMQYLIRLVSPKGSTILDCFNGSGSTGKAVMYENRERQKDYKYIGIELTPEYLPIAKARIESAQKGQMGFDL